MLLMTIGVGLQAHHDTPLMASTPESTLMLAVILGLDPSMALPGANNPIKLDTMELRAMVAIVTTATTHCTSLMETPFGMITMTTTTTTANMIVSWGQSI